MTHKIAAALNAILVLASVIVFSGCGGAVNVNEPKSSQPLQAAIEVSSSSISFENVAVGSNSSQALIITNTGTATLIITQVTETGSAFSVNGFSLPLNVSVGQQTTITVAFQPTAAGVATGSISIVSNASGSPAMASLSGTGVVPVQYSVALTWDASTSTVSGYNVYRSTISGSFYAKINSSLVAAFDYTDSTVQSGKTYYYVTTAVDSDGNESAYSNQASATVP